MLGRADHVGWHGLGGVSRLGESTRRLDDAAPDVLGQAVRGMARIARRRQHGDVLAPDAVFGVLGQPIGGGEQAGQGILGWRGGFAGDDRPGLDAVEQLVDGRLGLGGDEDRRALPAVGEAGLDEGGRQRVAVLVGPFVEPVLDSRIFHRRARWGTGRALRRDG